MNSPHGGSCTPASTYLGSVMSWRCAYTAKPAPAKPALLNSGCSFEMPHSRARSSSDLGPHYTAPQIRQPCCARLSVCASPPTMHVLPHLLAQLPLLCPPLPQQQPLWWAHAWPRAAAVSRAGVGQAGVKKQAWRVAHRICTVRKASSGGALPGSAS